MKLNERGSHGADVPRSESSVVPEWFGDLRLLLEVRAVRRAVVGVAVAALLVGCRGDKATSSAPGSNSTRPDVDRSLVTVRPIVAQSPAPCGAPTGAAQLVLPDPAHRSTCLALGPAGLDASGVANARLSATSATDVALDLDLNDAGKRSFAQFATAHIEERLAMLVNGRVVSTATVHAIDIPTIEIAGLSASEATDLVRAFGGDTTPPTTSPGQADVDRASTVCNDYAASAGQTNLVLASPTTAGEITSIARQVLGHTAPPWDSLPADHFVAVCSYFAPSSAAPSTTVCPDGDAVDLTRPKQLLVDEEGRATDDRTADAVPMTPCP